MPTERAQPQLLLSSPVAVSFPACPPPQRVSMCPVARAAGLIDFFYSPLQTRDFRVTSPASRLGLVGASLLASLSISRINSSRVTVSNFRPAAEHLRSPTSVITLPSQQQLQDGASRIQGPRQLRSPAKCVPFVSPLSFQTRICLWLTLTRGLRGVPQGLQNVSRTYHRHGLGGHHNRRR